MKKVTILKVYTEYPDSYYETYTFENAVQNAKFEEISDDQFQELTKALKILNSDIKNYDVQYILVEDIIKNSLFETMNDVISKALEILKEKEEAKLKADLLKKEKETQKKEKELEKKRKLLESLKKELEPIEE